MRPTAGPLPPTGGKARQQKHTPGRQPGRPPQPAAPSATRATAPRTTAAAVIPRYRRTDAPAHPQTTATGGRQNTPQRRHDNTHSTLHTREPISAICRTTRPPTNARGDQSALPTAKASGASSAGVNPWPRNDATARRGRQPLTVHTGTCRTGRYTRLHDVQFYNQPTPTKANQHSAAPTRTQPREHHGQITVQKSVGAYRTPPRSRLRQLTEPTNRPRPPDPVSRSTSRTARRATPGSFDPSTARHRAGPQPPSHTVPGSSSWPNPFPCRPPFFASTSR